MIEIEVETTTEIWRTKNTTFTVMYPFPNVAYIKGLRGSFTRELREAMKEMLKERGIEWYTMSWSEGEIEDVKLLEECN